MTQSVPSHSLSTRQIRVLGFGSLIGIIALISLAGYFQTARMHRQLDEIQRDYRRPMEAIDALLNGFVEIRGLMMAFVIEEKTDAQPILSRTEKLMDDTERLYTLISEEGALNLLENFRSALKEFRTTMVAYSNEIALSRTGESVRSWEQTLLSIEGRTFRYGGDLKQYMAAQIIAKEADIRQHGQALQAWNLGFGVLGIVSGFLVAYLLQKALRQPVDRLIGVAQRVADGDLTQSIHITRSDEIGYLAKAIGAMVENLQIMVTGIRDTFQALDSAAQDVERAAGQVSQKTNYQSQEIQNISQSVETMSSTFRELTQNVQDMTRNLDQASASVYEMSTSIKSVHNMADTMAGEVDAIGSSLLQMNQVTGQSVELLNSLTQASMAMAETVRHMARGTESVGRHAQESKELAQTVMQMATTQGIPAVNNAVEVTRRNKSLVDSYSQVIYSLGQRSASIGEILDVMREVAQQTHLLSLNAAIIANQAGEHGKAFTVVAEEIGKLSETTGSNVKKIASVIKTVRTEVEDAVSLVTQVQEQADISIASTEKAGEILEEIVQMSQKSTGMATEIARTGLEQVQQSADILALVEDNVSQVAKISRAAEEQKKGSDLIVHSSSELNSIAERLKRSTEEQAQASSMVSQTLTDIHIFSRDVMAVMEEEERKARQAVESLQLVRDVAGTTLASMNDLMTTVNLLRDLSSKLGPEVARFKVSEGTGSRLLPG